MLANFCLLEAIHAIISDGSLDPVVVDRRSGLLPALRPDQRPPIVVAADPPHRPIRDRLTGITGLVGKELLPELSVVTTHVEQGVRAIGLVEIPFCNRVLQSAIEQRASRL